MEYLSRYSKKVFPRIVGIIYYNRVNHDRFGSIICDVRDIHRLEAVEHKIIKVLQPKNKKRCDGAEISGYWYPIYGKENCKKMMMAFLGDCENRLKKAGASGIEIVLKEI
jgi:hypothetical protein